MSGPKRIGPAAASPAARANTNIVAHRQNTAPCGPLPTDLAEPQSEQRSGRRRATERRLRLQRDLKQLRFLGVRAKAEFIVEIAEAFGPYVHDRLAEYVRRLSPAALYVAGGDRLPPMPMPCLVGGAP